MNDQINSLNFTGIPEMKPETKLLINSLQQQYEIIKAEPVYFLGASAGSEFLTYDSKKLYVALQVGVLPVQLATTTKFYITLYKDNINSIGMIGNIIPVWNAAANDFYYNNLPMILDNLFFAKLTTSASLFLLFNGYRLTLK